MIRPIVPEFLNVWALEGITIESEKKAFDICYVDWPEKQEESVAKAVLKRIKQKRDVY